MTRRKDLGRMIGSRMSAGLRAALALSAALIWLLLACSSPQQAATQDPAGELARGNYETAIAAFQKMLSANPGDQNAQAGLLRAYLETGKYREAEESARKYLSSRQADARIRLLLGDAMAATGKYREAAAEFETAERSAKGVERMRSILRRGEMLDTVGQTEEADRLFEMVLAEEEKIEETTAESLTLAARALTHLERFKEANDYYLDAIETDKEYIDAHLGGGELFTSKYNYADAAEFFSDALEINPNSARAHFGVAMNKRIGGGEEMRQALARALKINPSYVEAIALGALIDLEAERYEKAAAELDKALKINPNSLDAHSLRAALYFLQHRTADFDAEVKATLAINPRYGDLYETLSHFATITRRYRQAADFSRQAIALEPNHWAAHLSLGTALLRLGQAAEGRSEVEKAFEGDPYNVWAKNTLDLLDSMAEYKESKRGPFVLKAAAKEADVLEQYAGDLLEEVHRTLTTKYKFTPKEPIWVEFFPNHEDFAVRTLGLPGLSALGVCFGQVIAQDSPSARPGGTYNWGSTLWHEYTHVITLQITDHMIPRWLSEGLSVYEERRARPGWGDDWNAAWLRAFSEGRWFKLSEIDAAFTRPRRPDDVPLGYFQASQICEFIEEKYGFNAILDILAQYRERKKTREIFEQVLKLSESEFDAAFKEFVQSKAGRFLKAVDSARPEGQGGQPSKEALRAQLGSRPDDFLLHLRLGAALQAEGDIDGAVTHLKRSIELYPFQTGEGSAHMLLAQLEQKRGNREAAVAALEGLLKVDENNYAALKTLAGLRQELGNKQGALEALRLSFFVNPFEQAAHSQAGSLLLDLNQPDQAIREFQVALALNPPNVAEAHYNLARAQLAAGRNAEAKRSVLRSLEAAPGFDKAQELLLRLTRP